MTNVNKTPHIHSALIKAWADGAEIEFEDNGVWYPCRRRPAWTPSTRYRVKPEPKPDWIETCSLAYNPDFGFITLYGSTPNIQFVFDGETKELKDVQLLVKE